MIPPASGATGNTFPKEFSYGELADATKNFTECMIGKGGFGEVFKASLGDQNLEVAIKRLSSWTSDQGVKEFKSEVNTLGRLRHENLVQLYGWCDENEELLLVYEFMPNGSLFDHLFKNKRLLTWEERYKIVLDLASGLLHLHEERGSYIIHRDIKSPNVLLDVDFKAKLGDFGLARVVEEEKEPVTTFVAGTKGYLDPEFESRQPKKPSKESDMYSFGIVALEIGCGRIVVRPIGSLNLVQWVGMLYDEGNILGAADPKLRKEFDENEMKCLLVLGLCCAQRDPSARPTIRNAIDMLRGKAPLPPLPQEMPCISGPGPSNDHSPINADRSSSNGTREMASSSGFHVTIDEMRPTSQNTMVPPASGTTGIVFPKEFWYRELVDATDNFMQMIGKGGFGQVFKGFLGDHNLLVAVKKFSKRPDPRGVKQFESEVKTLSRLRHENLVQLYGWCNEEKELILVYEFMPNGSLCDHLYKKKRLLTWKERYKIVQDLASGLLHLHEEGGSYIIHRDINSSNVFLDVDFKSKLGGFGLARLVEEGEDPLTTYIAGTIGYLAPECEVRRQRPSKESDVYSFGIVALEIGCGRKALGFVDEPNRELVQWVWMLYGNGNILEAADPRLRKEFDENEMKCLLVVGLWCAHPDPIARPTIGEAKNILLQKAPLPPIPEDRDAFYSSSESYTAPSGASQ